jgi:hypothetical protein
MTNAKSQAVFFSALAALASAGTLYAQQPLDHVTCRAGTLSALAQADKLVVWQLDHRGVTRGADANDPFDGFTQRCIGTIANIEGKLASNGWCRNVDPKTGDWTLVSWMGSDKPGVGTWEFHYGSGKWKGITGGGTYEVMGLTRPVEAGTYQNCARVKGTAKFSG